MQRRVEPVPSYVPLESDCIIETEGDAEPLALVKSSRINTTPHTVIDGPGAKFGKHMRRRREGIDIADQTFAAGREVPITPHERNSTNPQFRAISLMLTKEASDHLAMTPQKHKPEAPSLSPLRSFLSKIFT